MWDYIVQERTDLLYSSYQHVSLVVQCVALATVIAFLLAAVLAVAACRVGRGLTDEEVRRFNVPTPPSFDFSKRQCPPLLGR